VPAPAKSGCCQRCHRSKLDSRQVFALGNALEAAALRVVGDGGRRRPDYGAEIARHDMAVDCVQTCRAIVRRQATAARSLTTVELVRIKSLDLEAAELAYADVHPLPDAPSWGGYTEGLRWATRLPLPRAHG
jgi:hypothetical protein